MDGNEGNFEHSVAPREDAGYVQTLPFEAERYWAHLDGLDITDKEKNALLESLWSIISTFVEIGFGVDPVQQVIPALVQAALDDEDSPVSTMSQQFKTAALSPTPRKEESS